MAHWAEIDENSFVVRVVVTDNNEPDEGYQWLVDNLGGTWIKCSYNTINGIHINEGIPLRWTFPAIGSPYLKDLDIFLEPSPHKGWLIDKENKTWIPPIPKPDSGFWVWDDELENWKEYTDE